MDSSAMPRGVEDIPEKDLRELARWFKSRSAERRRLLKRYKIGRQKTEALAARKQVCVCMRECVCACVRACVPTRESCIEKRYLASQTCSQSPDSNLNVTYCCP